MDCIPSVYCVHTVQLRKIASSFSKLLVTGYSQTLQGKMNRHSRGSPARLYFHSRGTPATFASIPAGTPRHQLSSPRESRGVRGIPVIPIPVQVSNLHSPLTQLRCTGLSITPPEKRLGEPIQSEFGGKSKIEDKHLVDTLMVYHHAKIFSQFYQETKRKKHFSLFLTDNNRFPTAERSKTPRSQELTYWSQISHLTDSRFVRLLAYFNGVALDWFASYLSTTDEYNTFVNVCGCFPVRDKQLNVEKSSKLTQIKPVNDGLLKLHKNVLLMVPIHPSAQQSS